MRREHVSRTREISLFVLLFSAAMAACLPVPSVRAAMTPINDVVVYPLPTNPEPVLTGGDLRVDVSAGSGASGWTGGLSSRYGSATLNLVNTSFSGGSWTVFFGIPEGIRPALYDLVLGYADGGDAVEYTQPRSVWVMESWPETLKVAQISDIHLPYGADVFATYLYEANLVDPDLIVVTGDVVDQEILSSAWGYLQDLLGRLDVPIYLIPGNHDYSGADSAYYQQFGGMKNYTVVIGDFLLLALDSHGGGYVYQEQIDWADSVLARYSDKVKIIAFHHPLLSSEYEDDEGRVKGGEITGDWSDIEGLWDVMYFTWQDNLDLAQGLLRVIQTHDVELILGGHVHRDIIYILNGEHHFVTTSTSGGGLPPTFKYCSRLIEVGSDGTIDLGEYTESRKFDPPNAIPTGEVTYFYSGANDGSGTSVSARVVNDLDFVIDDAHLEFLVSDDVTADQYSFYPEQPDTVEIIETDSGHLFVVTVDVPAESVLDLTLASSDDGVEPAVEVAFPEDYDEGEPIPVSVEVSDSGWGLGEVTASYSLDGSTWIVIDTPVEADVDKYDYEINLVEASYSFTVFDAPEGSTLQVRVEATDFAGNQGTEEASFSVGEAPTPTHTLAVDSAPVSNVGFKLNGVDHTTPFSEVLDEGTYTVSVPLEFKTDDANYTFTGWADGVSDAERTVDLDSDVSLEAEYEEVVVEEPEPEPDETEPEPDETEAEPRGGIPIPYAAVMAGLALGMAMLRRFRRE